VRIRFVNANVQGVEDLVSGFQLSGGERWARPAGVAIGPDGALYFSSDGGSHALFRLQPTTELAAHRAYPKQGNTHAVREAARQALVAQCGFNEI